jgi:hypothetical protein
MSGEINMSNGIETSKIEKLKSEIFDTIRQIEYLVNVKTQKLQELNILENAIIQTNIKDTKTAEK